MPDTLPAIESAYLNMQTARRDCEHAQNAWALDNWDDSVMWINNAISQLESARHKIKSYQESNASLSLPRDERG